MTLSLYIVIQLIGLFPHEKKITSFCKHFDFTLKKIKDITLFYACCIFTHTIATFTI